MAGVGVEGSVCSGHGKFPPRPSVTGDPFFLINGIPVMTDGAIYPNHTDGNSVHSGVAISSKPWFLINGKGIVCIGDPVSCGSVVVAGDLFFNVT